MLPPGFERRVLTTISLTQREPDTAALNENQQNLLEFLKRKSPVKLGEVETFLGKKRSSTVIGQLIELGLVERTYQLEPVKVKTQQVPYIRLTIDIEPALLKPPKNLKKKLENNHPYSNSCATQAGPVSLAEAKLKARLR